MTPPPPSGWCAPPFADCFLLSGPSGLKLDGADRAVATATGLRAGAYRFRLTVCDQQGATDSALLTVQVLQSKSRHTWTPSRVLALIRTPSRVLVLIRISSSPPADPGLPPVAHAGGSHTLTLPNNSLVLRGSVTNGDQTEVRFQWVRDRQSPAAGVRTGGGGGRRGRGLS